MLTREVLEDFRHIVLFAPTKNEAQKMLLEAMADAKALGWSVDDIGPSLLEHEWVVLHHPSSDRFMPGAWKVRISYPGMKMCGWVFQGARPDFCLYRGKPKVKGEDGIRKFNDWLDKVFFPAFDWGRVGTHTRIYPA